MFLYWQVDSLPLDLRGAPDTGFSGLLYSSPPLLREAHTVFHRTPQENPSCPFTSGGRGLSVATRRESLRATDEIPLLSLTWNQVVKYGSRDPESCRCLVSGDELGLILCPAA